MENDAIDVSIYGYGDAAPDVPATAVSTRDYYGYETAALSSSSDSASKYGYGDAEPDSASKYGYGDAVLHSDRDDSVSATTTTRMPRRSSMKGSSNNKYPRRRASIGACCESSTIEVQLPGQMGTIRRRRSITFEESVNVQRVEPAISLAEDPSALWLQDREYDFISTKILTLIQHVHESDSVAVDSNGTVLINGTPVESRGLEPHLTPELTELNKARARDCVMHEQFMQRQVGDYDEDTLANIYKFSTIRSQRQATQRATQDAKEVEEYLQSTRQMFRHRRASM
ncbi:hypothetical protein IV203_024342 [Nitzschia inconspicua]|uniref:Uncharacterized protein n=1 Tax=Nitzschia inconspicua TaxID=303405 RepID=A0A9K3PD75_9STRA|nr:hypothetical protein IV203_024342 [Nitzschia inconspicua]